MATTISNADFLLRYEEIAALSAQMLAAARRDDWNGLIGMQDDYIRLVASLKAVDETMTLAESERQRKFDLIRQILADDAAIRDLASPRLARLSALLAVNRQTRALQDMHGLY
jgi:flagellar protein FliT